MVQRKRQPRPAPCPPSERPKDPPIRRRPPSRPGISWSGNLTKGPEMQAKTRNWTLAVVSLATAMLMLDIAVVNTAISDMGRDLHTGLDGLKWVVDAYTLALA